MISRIRVEARAATMDEAKREIETILAAASQVVYLEGLGGAAALSGNHFGEVYENDGWAQHGMRFEGRHVLSFEPWPNPGGGLKQYSFIVTGDESEQPPEMRSESHGADLTSRTMVLYREHPITRDYDYGNPITMENVLAEGIVAPTEVLLGRLRGLDTVRKLTVEAVTVGLGNVLKLGGVAQEWKLTALVGVTPDATPFEVTATRPSLRDAVIDMIEKCGGDTSEYMDVSDGGDALAAPAVRISGQSETLAGSTTEVVLND